MFALFGGLLIAHSLVVVAGLLTVGFLILSAGLWNKLAHMSEDDWNRFFAGFPVKRFIAALFLLHMAMLALMSYFGQFVYGWFSFEKIALLSALTFAYGVIRILCKIRKKGRALFEKLSNIHTRVPSETEWELE